MALACVALGDQKGRGFLQTRDFDDKAFGGSSRIVSLLPFGCTDGSFIEIDTIDDVVPRERCRSDTSRCGRIRRLRLMRRAKYI